MFELVRLRGKIYFTNCTLCTGKNFTPAVTEGTYFTFDHIYVTRGQDDIDVQQMCTI